jgi:hypothetical protein
MAGAPGGQGTPDPPDPDPGWSWSSPPTAVPPDPDPPAAVPPDPDPGWSWSSPPAAVPPTTVPPTAVPPVAVPTAAVPPPHPPTQPNTAGGNVPASPATQTVTGSPQRGSWWHASSGRSQEIVRHGPGVPAVPVTQAEPTAAQVWRTGLPSGDDRRKKPLYRRVVGPAITGILLIASLVVIYTRLQHAPFGVTGVAIAQEVKSGCTVDITARIGTTGGAGTVSYEWMFQPQLETPQPLSQTVVAGQTAVYVTAAVQGQGHGTLTQSGTLQVLGPGRDSASARIVVSC